MIYVNALDLFSSSVSLGLKYQGLAGEGWLVDEFWGLYPLLEWVGCAGSVVFLVRRTKLCTLSLATELL